jgi:hypothetical protein
MDRSKGWGLRRYLTLLTVLAVHAGLVALLMMGSSSLTRTWSEDETVQLLYVPPPGFARIRSENSRPQVLAGNTEISLAPPHLDITAPSTSPSAGGAEGVGPGVDWKAEARRAVQAFDIRSREPPSDPLPMSPAEDWWWPRMRHRLGEPYKTSSGDWIVWISTNCYQVARAVALTPSSATAAPPQTVCLGEPKLPGGAGSGATN